MLVVLRKRGGEAATGWISNRVVDRCAYAISFLNDIKGELCAIIAETKRPFAV